MHETALYPPFKDADRVSFLDAPISPSGLFGPADSLSASQRHRRRHRLATLPAQVLQPSSCSESPQDLRRLSSPRNLHLPFPPLSLLGLSSHEGVHAQPDATPLRSARAPRPKIALGHCASGVLLICRTGRERVESRHGRTAHQKASHEKPLCTPFLPGAEEIVFVATGSVQAPCNRPLWIVEKIKHKLIKKRAVFLFSSLTSALPPCSRPLEFIQPLATRAEAWQAIPGVSEWVMGIIKRGLFTPIRSKTSAFQRRGLHLGARRERSRLCSEVMTFAGKRSHRMVPPALSESGFYSRYFPRPQKGWRPPAILDLRRLNHALMRRPFRMITLKISSRRFAQGTGFCSLDLKDAYFHIQIAPHHRRFLEIHFEGVAYQYTGPTLWAVSGPPVLLRSAWTRLFPL